MRKSRKRKKSLWIDSWLRSKQSKQRSKQKRIKLSKLRKRKIKKISKSLLKRNQERSLKQT